MSYWMLPAEVEWCHWLGEIDGKRFVAAQEHGMPWPNK